MSLIMPRTAYVDSSTAALASGPDGSAFARVARSGRFVFASVEGAAWAARVARASATTTAKLRVTPSRRELDDKGGALPRRRMPDLDPAVVEFLDDALDQREPEAPSARARRVAGLEGAGELLGRHAPAVVVHGELDPLQFGAVLEADLDPAPLLVDRVDRVDEKVLDHPLEQLPARAEEWHRAIHLTDLDSPPQVRQPPSQVVYRLPDDRGDVDQGEVRDRSDVAEACRHLVEPGRVVLHLAEHRRELVSGE